MLQPAKQADERCDVFFSFFKTLYDILDLEKQQSSILILSVWIMHVQLKEKLKNNRGILSTDTRGSSLTEKDHSWPVGGKAIRKRVKSKEVPKWRHWNLKLIVADNNDKWQKWQ